MNTLRNELETLVHTVDANALDERRVLQAKRGCAVSPERTRHARR
jgi:hypothetical protein